MKSLFILPDRFPHSGACSSLLVKMLTEGKLADKLGHTHVLVPKYEKDEPDLEMVGNVTVHRVLLPSFLPAPELKKFKTRPDVLLHGVLTKLWDRKIARGLYKGRFLQGCLTKELQRSIARLHKKENFQVLVPVAGSYEIAAAAMAVAKKKNIGLLVYQVDPCSTNASFSRKSLTARQKLEDALYRNADAVITTPIILAERQAACKPDLEKAVAMEFPNVSAETVSPVNRENTEEKTCVFAGRLYHGIRNPRYTVSLFEQLADRNIQLHMYGVTNEELLNYGIAAETAKKIFCYGLCPLDMVQEKLRQADVVVNIGNIMTNQVPSKIFEYISSCKPIVNIAANSNCPSVPYMQRYPMALTLVEGEGSIEENTKLLETFITENAGQMAEQKVILETFHACTAAFCAEVMATKIQEMVNDDG